MSSYVRYFFIFALCSSCIAAYTAAGPSFFPFTAESTTASSKWRPDINLILLGSSLMNNADFLSGWVCAMIFIPLGRLGLKRLLGYFLSNDDNDDNLYGLDHAVLNVEIPPKSMWMNMGYWEHAKNLEEACRCLLQKVLEKAGLLDENGRPARLDGHSRIKLLDVGFGCGDQTLYLTYLSRLDGLDTRRRPLFESYVGITINRHQAEFARQRLQERTAFENNLDHYTPNIHVFCADAANPKSWGGELNEAILGSLASGPASDSERCNATSIWLLALDTLYHFRPSREPLFTYAHRLHASIMAFDLILSDSASIVDRILLRLVCRIASTPFSNFKTQSAYEQMLVKAGYSAESMEMHDISEYVFSGISGYIHHKEGELKRFGMSVGKLKGAGKIFSWWAKSGILRGMIVVARRRDTA